jgi:hypothetical protein
VLLIIILNFTNGYCALLKRFLMFDSTHMQMFYTGIKWFYVDSRMLLNNPDDGLFNSEGTVVFTKKR